MTTDERLREEPTPRRPRRWRRVAVVFSILLLLFGVPWLTLVVGGAAWPTAVVVVGSIAFAAALFLPVLVVVVLAAVVVALWLIAQRVRAGRRGGRGASMAA